MKDEEILALLRLQKTPMIGDIVAKKLIAHVGYANDIFKEKKDIGLSLTQEVMLENLDLVQEKSGMNIVKTGTNQMIFQGEQKKFILIIGKVGLIF